MPLLAVKSNCLREKPYKPGQTLRERSRFSLMLRQEVVRLGTASRAVFASCQGTHSL